MKNKKKLVPKIIMMAMSCIVGAVVGILLVKRSDIKGSNGSLGKELFKVIIIVASIYISYFLGIIIHESGHLVMGLLTGYRFVSFRIGSFILVKQDGRFVIRRFSLAGTGGQCLMKHDKVEKDEDIPYFWYHSGGGLFNLASAALLCLVYLNTSSKYLAIYSMIGMIIYFFMGLINLIPLKKIGLANDGSNILESWLDPSVRRSVLNILMVNAEQMQGKTLDSMPEELFEVNSKGVTNASLNIMLLRAARDLERGDIDTAKAKFKALLEKHGIPDILIKEIRCDLLFCYIMTDEPAEVIDELYNDELQKYIKTSGKYTLCRHRLMYAYYYIYKQDIANADKEYNLSAEMAKGYYNPGEARSEMSIIERIKENH